MISATLFEQAELIRQESKMDRMNDFTLNFMNWIESEEKRLTLF